MAQVCPIHNIHKINILLVGAKKDKNIFPIQANNLEMFVTIYFVENGSISLRLQ